MEAGMAYVYNRGSPTKPNIWIGYVDANGKEVQKPVGKAPRGLTKRQAKRWEVDLQSQAREQLALLEVVKRAPDLGLRLPDEPKLEPLPPFEESALTWAKERKEAKDSDGQPVYRSGDHDLQRMTRYLIPEFRGKRLDEVQTGDVKRLITRLHRKLSGSTIKLVVMLLSRFYNDLIEDGMQLHNPVVRLDRATRKKKLKNRHDPKDTPFLSKAHVRLVYLALPEHIRPMYAVGALAGLRKGEILGLQWGDIHLQRRTIKVSRQKVHGKRETGPLKDDETRIVPINDTLLGVLRAWKLKGRSTLWVFPSRIGELTDDHTPNDHFNEVLEKIRKEQPEVPQVTWYQGTRHSYASNFVLDGNSIERLALILGHSSTYVTERYTHLRPDAFGELDYRAGCVDLAEGDVVELSTAHLQFHLQVAGRGND